MATCKECGSAVHDGFKFCAQCGARIETLPPLPAPPATGTFSGLDTVFTRTDPGVNLAVGSTFDGRYAIEARLGQGAMGVVYLATDTRLTRRQVALKVIHPAIVGSASIRQRFIREGLITRDIRHRNVVAV